jgi:transketolase
VFRKTKGRPTFIVLDSHIGYGSPHKQDTPEAHGEPLGDEEIRLTKRGYGWPEDAQFLVPDGVYHHFAAGIGQRGATARQDWTKRFTTYRTEYPDLAKEIDQMQRRELPAGWDRNLPSFPADPKGIAGREASGKVLNVLAQNIPWLLGGSADLGPSNKTALTYEGAGSFQAESPGGKNLHYGIREHAMGAIVNGLSLSKIRGYGSTFFIFSDYARPAPLVRLQLFCGLPLRRPPFSKSAFRRGTRQEVGAGGPSHRWRCGFPAAQSPAYRPVRSGGWKCVDLYPQRGQPGACRENSPG